MEEREKKGSNAVLKDLNLANEVQQSKTFPEYASKHGINIGAVPKASLLSQLRKDIGLLIECGVMDYSLLVGVVDMESKGKPFDTVIKSGQIRKRQSQGFRKFLNRVSTPLRLATAPPRYLVNQLFSLGEKTLSTILTIPLPYYGAGFSVVDGGDFSVFHGTRLGHRAIYYMGVIDFLQPWTTKKILEREVKAMIGYDAKAISCVDPKFYASRFLDFMTEHMT